MVERRLQSSRALKVRLLLLNAGFNLHMISQCMIVRVTLNKAVKSGAIFKSVKRSNCKATRRWQHEDVPTVGGLSY